MSNSSAFVKILLLIDKVSRGYVKPFSRQRCENVGAPVVHTKETKAAENEFLESSRTVANNVDVERKGLSCHMPAQLFPDRATIAFISDSSASHGLA